MRRSIQFYKSVSAGFESGIFRMGDIGGEIPEGGDLVMH